MTGRVHLRVSEPCRRNVCFYFSLLQPKNRHPFPTWKHWHNSMFFTLPVSVNLFPLLWQRNLCDFASQVWLTATGIHIKTLQFVLMSFLLTYSSSSSLLAVCSTSRQCQASLVLKSGSRASECGGWRRWRQCSWTPPRWGPFITGTPTWCWRTEVKREPTSTCG